MLVWYVEGNIIAGSTDETIAYVKAHLSGSFRMKDLGDINARFLGFDINLVNDAITISMETYIKVIIAAYGLDDCHRERPQIMLVNERP